MMLRRTPLKQNKRLNAISKKQIGKLNAEVEDRKALCYRCGGTPHVTTQDIRLNDGKQYQLQTVICIGGVCEICGKPAGNYSTLHPHEKLPRSRGGKLSLENSVMCHDYPCHQIAQNNMLKGGLCDVPLGNV